MMKHSFKRTTCLFLGTLPLLAACSEIPQEAYFNRGTPESLLDMSSESVSVALGSGSGGRDELVGWVNQEQPTRADLACAQGEAACEQAREVLDQFRVPYQYGDAGRNAVVLYYERVLARDCENRFIDNSVNPYNFNHPTFGCSIAANTVQQVSDKRQFINPALLDFTDGQKSVQAVRRYQKATPDPDNSGYALDKAPTSK